MVSSSGSAGLCHATTSTTHFCVLQNSTSPCLYLCKHLDKSSGKAVQAVQVDHPLPQIVPHGGALCWGQRQQGCQVLREICGIAITKQERVGVRPQGFPKTLIGNQTRTRARHRLPG